MDKQYLNPAALGAPPRFYSHAVAIAGPAKLVYVSGQVSWGPDGKVVGAGDMRAQCEQVFKNLTHVLRAAGAGWADIIKMNGYMVGINAENVAAYRDVRSGYLKAKQLPASTLVGVTSLVQPELLLEVEVVAAVGPKKKKR
jgi:enamine deaminase RidA (YjgF/YER057c/UK114 family)